MKTVYEIEKELQDEKIKLGEVMMIDMTNGLK